MLMRILPCLTPHWRVRSKSQSLIDDFLSRDERRVRVMHVAVSLLKVTMICALVTFTVCGCPVWLVLLPWHKRREISWEIYLWLGGFLGDLRQKSWCISLRARHIQSHSKISKNSDAILSPRYLILIILGSHFIELLLSPHVKALLLIECTYLSLICLVLLGSSPLWLFHLFRESFLAILY